MSSGRVFVVQKQIIWDGDGYVPKFDMSTAEPYGDLVYLLGPKDNERNPLPVIQRLHQQLRSYSADDYLLLVGNPALIGWTTAIAGMYNKGIVRQLLWSGHRKTYEPVWVDLQFSID